jgi:hypothetical protein
LWGIRYQVADVSRSVDFYTKQLGFNLDHQKLPAFAQVSIANLRLILSGPGASDSRPMPDGHSQAPGGWNRVILHVENLPDRIETLQKRVSVFAKRWKQVPEESKSFWMILTAIPSNCSNRLSSRIEARIDQGDKKISAGHDLFCNPIPRVKPI